MSFLKKIFTTIYIILTITLLSLLIYATIHIIELGDQDKKLKIDYTQLHSVQYGLFNSAIWTNKISFVVDQKIDEFDFTENSRIEIKKYIESILDTLIIQADRVIRERNKRERKRSFFGNILGSTKQMITDTLIDIKDLRKKVPEFTDAVLDELERPHNQKLLKSVLREKLKQLTTNNLARTDMKIYNNIMAKYNTTNYDSCSKALDQRLELMENKINQYATAMLVFTFMIIVLILLQGTILKSISLLFLSITSISLLIPGIMLPMLDIEAKIETLFFTILEKPIIFSNQILFFQSKSIYDLVNLLIQSDEGKMVFVGVLLTTFSVIFPTLKLIFSYIYFYSRCFIGNNPITRFFALRSTKWSMADVMVVSIFMAYLGLDGVVSNELKLLEEKSEPINVITTNGTDLEVGFFLFLGFVVTSFVLSTLIAKTKSKD